MTCSCVENVIRQRSPLLSGFGQPSFEIKAKTPLFKYFSESPMILVEFQVASVDLCLVYLQLIAIVKNAVGECCQKNAWGHRWLASLLWCIIRKQMAVPFRDLFLDAHGATEKSLHIVVRLVNCPKWPAFVNRWLRILCFIINESTCHNSRDL